MKKSLTLLIALSILTVSCEKTQPSDDTGKPTPVKLQTPKNFKAATGEITLTSISLTWDQIESKDLDGYTVEYSTAGSEKAEVKKSKTNSLTVSSLQEATEYTFRLRANSLSGTEYDSDWSAPLAVSTLAPEGLDAPQNLRVVEDQTTSSRIALEWDAVAGAAEYILSYKKEGEAEFTDIKTESPEYLLTELMPGELFKVKVCAVAGDDTSDYSEEIGAKTMLRSMGICDAQDFAAFATGAADGGEWRNEAGEVVILRDIDMSGVEWTPIPEFAGVLDGNGKTISNLTCTSSDAEYVGLVALLSGSIKNLTLDANCSFESNRSADSGTAEQTTKTGSFAALMKGGRLESCTNKASVKIGIGCDYAGGLVGLARPDENGEAAIADCVNEGSVAVAGAVSWVREKQLYVNIGGIAGAVEKGTALSGCTNKGVVSSALTSSAQSNRLPVRIGGVMGSALDVTVSSCLNDAAGTVKVSGNPHYSYIGGVAGYLQGVSLDACVNRGVFDITQEAADLNSEFELGGISGSFANSTMTETMTVNGCRNYSDITLVAISTAKKPLSAGGIFGFVRCAGVAFNITDCHNEGAMSVTATTSTSKMGGIIARAEGSAESTVAGCSNKGELNSYQTSNTAFHVGGIVGVNASAKITVAECRNKGNITVNNTQKAYGGGIVGEATGSPVRDCVNTGRIFAPNNESDVAHLGGVVARTYRGAAISGCRNEGDVIYGGSNPTIGNSKSGGFGGIVGYLDKDKATVENCVNTGTILGDPDGKGKKGAICGWASADGETSITNCVVNGALGNYDAEAEDLGVSAATALTADNFADYIYGAKINALTESGNVFSK